MSNMMFMMLESGMKAAAKPKEKKQPSILYTGLVSLIGMSSVLFFVVCLLCALPYVFLP